MKSGLQRRLLVLLLLPLLFLAALNTWFDYRLADSAALEKDKQLLALVPLLADSIVGAGPRADAPPQMLMAPPLEEFLDGRGANAAWAILDLDGQVLLGDRWLDAPLPTTREPEFYSDEYGGVLYRVISQRVFTSAGEMVVRLSDGSDTRQQWLLQLVLKVVLPNVTLAIFGYLAFSWAIRVALGPLIQLKDAVERRSPKDLSPIDLEASPDEVRPLVEAINRVFGLLDAQAQGQARFIADAAHQLRTPLAGLQAQVEAWAQTVNGGGQADWRDRAVGMHDPSTQGALTHVTLRAEQVLKLRDAARRTSQLANQLLALSRVDARSAYMQPMQRVDLPQLCEALLEHYLDIAARKNIDLGLELHPAHVSGYEWLLRELLSNLLDNALKYTPASGRVTLRCGTSYLAESAQTHAFLEVEDDGPGIPMGERAFVLERFYRIQGVEEEGNGLGLAIAQEVALLHHSHLQLKTGGQGQGLLVRLELAT
ncbi:sensor histidine kinase [Rhodoferax aquaticus]|uniref:histidine kinase n=1 Tax=Rhodoferax aquaticus TaxID=2527691 RepID=A0A515EL85_9BURK|nr:sensor histidine kinase [Rhodoferax aquaticus]QDL53422.1 sensor histidine kinase [Rhodoferax aquaticus]